MSHTSTQPGICPYCGRFTFDNGDGTFVCFCPDDDVTDDDDDNDDDD